MISKDDILKVKDTARIDEVIANSGVTLRSAGGGSMKGLCPFHDERTPSFTVRTDFGRWRCYGCQRGGDVISYLEEKEGMTFTESVRFLAGRYGIEITEDESEDDSGLRRRIYDINAEAALFFRSKYDELEPSHPAIQELVNRDLAIFAKGSGVGYAPQGWSSLSDHLVSKGFSIEDCVEAGVLNQNDAGRSYDAFRGRLTWEIRDIQDRVIGFGARKIFEDDGGGKYLNSKETAVYKKVNVLYGLNQARAVAAKESKMYIVEGYTDVMAFHAAGVYNVVASCGTSFGESHAGIIRRIIGEKGNFVFCFDGDSAGLAAARKAFDIKAPIQGVSLAVALEGGDPCDIRKKQGNSGLISQLENTKPLTEFVLIHELSKFDVKGSVEAKSEYLKAITPILLQISDPITRDEYVRRVTLWTGTTLEVAKDTLRHHAKVLRGGPAPQGGGYDEPVDQMQASVGTKDSESPSERFTEEEVTLLSIIAQYPECVQGSLASISLDLFSGSLRPAVEIVLRGVRNLPEGSEVGAWKKVYLREALDALPAAAGERFSTASFPALESSLENATRIAPKIVGNIVNSMTQLKRKSESQHILAMASDVSGVSTDDFEMELLSKIVEKQAKLRKSHK